jgi:hypothetical protein
MHADCGHYIPHDSKPAGEQWSPIASKWVSVYLCRECTPRRSSAIEEFKAETKQVR